jgi:hypothetical protein
MLRGALGEDDKIRLSVSPDSSRSDTALSGPSSVGEQTDQGRWAAERAPVKPSGPGCQNCISTDNSRGSRILGKAILSAVADGAKLRKGQWMNNPTSGRTRVRIAPRRQRGRPKPQLTVNKRSRRHPAGQGPQGTARHNSLSIERYMLNEAEYIRTFGWY